MAEMEIKNFAELIEWLMIQIDRCNKEIDDEHRCGGPFYELQAERQAYMNVLDII